MPELVKLTGQELVRLHVCEDKISRGIEVTSEVILALKEIKEGKLYRQDYKSFNEYCSQKWGFGANYAGKLIGASDVAEIVPIKNERQARAIKSREDQDKIEVWEAAKEKAGSEDKITAKILAAATREFRNRTPDYNGPDPEPVNEMVNMLRAAKKRLDELCTEDAGGYIPVECVRDLQQIINVVYSATPVGYCPQCKGNGCQWCAGLGWMSRQAQKRYEESKEDFNE